VSDGLENGLGHLSKKVAQGYSLMVFPEGTRSTTNKIKRFHKGAFFLAEHFNMDIVPVLIHGNSEVLPKGSYVIKNGSITVKILKRIQPEDQQYGITYRDRTKKIAAHFKGEFQQLRNDIEGDSYFLRTILEDYRYKGGSLYQIVRRDLKKYATTYSQISKHIGTTDSIIHLSKGYGQLDFLLSLNAVDRKIIAYLKDAEVRSIVKNSFITQQIAKITLAGSIDGAMEYEAAVLIIDLEGEDLDQLGPKIKNNVELLILVKESVKLQTSDIIGPGFKKMLEKDNLIILKKM
jgi:hypothetical protein